MPSEIHVHVHLSEDAERELDRLDRKLDRILAQGRLIIATQADFSNALSALNDATNAVAARLEALAGQVASGGISSDQEDSVVAQLTGLAEALRAMGQTPEDPVPVPVPEPTPDA